MIVRHNWWCVTIQGSQNIWQCTERKEQQTREEIDCFGCLASMSDGLGLTRNEPHLTEMDRLWHEELRPMAEFACLIEEADK